VAPPSPLRARATPSGKTENLFRFHIEHAPLHLVLLRDGHLLFFLFDSLHLIHFEVQQSNSKLFFFFFLLSIPSIWLEPFILVLAVAGDETWTKNILDRSGA